MARSEPLIQKEGFNNKSNHGINALPLACLHAPFLLKGSFLGGGGANKSTGAKKKIITSTTVGNQDDLINKRDVRKPQYLYQSEMEKKREFMPSKNPW